MATNCQSLKATLLDFLGTGINVAEIRDYCVLTLPQKTLDDRLVSVFVQEKMPGFFLVHDGGKAAAELFAQGIHVTDLKLQTLEELAERYGATFAHGAFRIGCKTDELNTAILSIAQCATLSTWHILGHKPSFTEEPVLHRVGAAIRAWDAPYVKEVRERVKVPGRKTQHVIDFVSFPLNVVGTPIGVKVVRPSDNPLEQARGFGFMAYDLENTPYETWARVAVVTKADEWTDTALELVRASAAGTVEVEAGREDEIQTLLPQRLSALAA